MSYRRVLVTRWSRRDKLAVVVIALTVAFVTGAGLVIDATATESTGLAAQYENPGEVTAHDTLQGARAASDSDAALLAVTTARTTAGESVRLVAVVSSPGESRSTFRLPAPPPDRTAQQLRLQTAGETVVTVDARRAGSDGLVPAGWYVTAPTALDRVGETTVLAIDQQGSVPLRTALPFFVSSSAQLLRLLALLAVGATVLLCVTVFGVTRVAVRDRHQTIRIIRTTGGTARQVQVLFGARAGLQTLVGTATGYAIGIIATNLVINAAVFLGYSTSLSMRISPRFALILGGLYLGLLITGVGSGVLAARPAATGSVAGTERPSRGHGNGRWTTPSLLGWRSLLPTVTTLTVFVVLVIVIASSYAAIGPLTQSSDTDTIVEPSAPHPFASSVPAAYATDIRAHGGQASPEILLLAVRKDQPYVARGANFSAFASLTEGALQRGHPPSNADEAVIGADLADTLGVGVGDHLSLGGTTKTALSRVEVVGIFTATEPFDDQLIVPLTTGRHLADWRPGTVHLIRTKGTTASTAAPVRVQNLSAPDIVAPNTTFRATVTLRNLADTAESRQLTARFGNETARRDVRVQPQATRTVSIRFDSGRARQAQLTVGARNRSVRVAAPGTLQLGPLPAEVPPNTTFTSQLTTVRGDPVANATVTIGNRTSRTGANGTVRLEFPAAGTYAVTARHDSRVTTTSVQVTPAARRQPSVQVAVSPRRLAPTTAPVATVLVSNPWHTRLSSSLTLVGPRTERTRQVTVAPGARRQLTVALQRSPPGDYAVAVQSGGHRVATTRYRVTGDARLASAVASRTDRAPVTGLGRTLGVVLGNIGLVFGLLIGLAGLATVGSTAAAFTGAVRARRRTLGIYRVTGASPLSVLRLVLRDALLVGSVAAVAAALLGTLTVVLLDAAGLLTAFGIRLLPTVQPLVIIAAALGALCIALVGAGLAALGILLSAPASLLTARS